MKRLLLVVGLVLSASPLMAQGPVVGATIRAADVAADEDLQPSLANLSPEMWLYMQAQQRHDDPQQAVRRKAEQRAAQRSNRIAARKWFGLSNARPTANPVPVMATYSPFWAGNESDPNRWSGVGPAVIRVEVDDSLLP